MMFICKYFCHVQPQAYTTLPAHTIVDYVTYLCILLLLSLFIPFHYENDFNNRVCGYNSTRALAVNIIFFHIVST